MTRFGDAVLRRAEGRRVRLAVLWEAFGEAAPVDAAAIDARQRLADALAEGERAGAWTCAKQADVAGRPPLPTFVTLPAAAEAERADPSRVAWRPELSWAAGLRPLSPTHLEMLTAVNAFLRDGGGSRPVVPAEERSLELFGDEKVIGKQVGGRTLWGEGRLSLELLRCVPSKVPFAYERVGNGGRLLVVENQATFATFRDLLRADQGHPYAAVVFGSGRSAGATISYVTDLSFTVAAVDYFGDLDVDGLEMAASCLAEARACGVAANLHDPLYRLLLKQPPSVATPASPDRAERALEVLAPDLAEQVRELFTTGLRIAQERCGRELLAQLPGWWDPFA